AGQAGSNSRALSNTTWLMYNVTSRAIATFHPCGHSWRKSMALYKRGVTWHYDFAVAGKGYRGSTKEKSETRARAKESTRRAEVINLGESGIPRKAPRLADFAPRFLEWVEISRLKPNTKRYYRHGWKLIEATPLKNMNLTSISSDVVEVVNFPGGPAYINQAVRTLRRMLGKAQDWKLIHSAPRLKLLQECGREDIIDNETEAKLLAHLKQPARDVFLIIQDTGLRPDEVFRMQIEQINWSMRRYFNASGKTRKSRRMVPLSQRILDALFLRCAD